MGIKSTTTLSRKDAEELYASLREKLYGIPRRRLTNEELGDALDNLREEECKREGMVCFDNYLVRDNGSDNEDR